MKKFLLALSLFASGLVTAHSALAGEAEARKAVENFLGERAKVEAVRKSGVLGLYEVQIGGDIVYADENGRYAFFGDIVDLKNRSNLTEERKLKLSQVKFSDLPLNMAIKQVRGNGKRVFASFEDPNCGYCKKFARETQGLTDITLYIFPYPILAQDSFEKSRNILCAADPAKAWNDWMVNGVAAPTAPAKCEVSMDKYVALGHKFNVRGTPNFILSDGNRIPGAIPQAQLEARLDALAK
ncbi:MAG: DsbC family protein [Rhodocyclaceae bacterium]|nr:DsbC family protein [Rhodocyclaceae bacterium]